jgi:hypothetical protein
VSLPIHHIVAAAPRAVAPFSHAVEADGFVFVTGQMPTDPAAPDAPLPPGIAGMLGMRWSYFTLINVISAFIWAASHILPGMFLSEWLKSIGLSLELVILVGALILGVLFLLIHYWKRILLALAPFMGNFGKSLQQRWQPPKTDQTPG